MIEVTSRSRKLVSMVLWSLAAVAANVGAQARWAREFGGIKDEWVSSVSPTSDGGCVFTGSTASFGAGGTDMWVVKTDASGNCQWQRAIGTAANEWGQCVRQTADGGYIVAGGTTSQNDTDILLVKLSPQGNLTWQRDYWAMDSQEDVVVWIEQTIDSGYVLAGTTSAPGGGGLHDVLVMKTDQNGAIVWKKRYGGAKNDGAAEVHQIPGGYIVAGYTESAGAGQRDALVLKLDSTGDPVLRCVYGLAGNDWARSILPTPFGYRVAGCTDSAKNDFFVLDLSSNLLVVWASTYGGGNSDVLQTMIATSDDGFVMAGSTTTFGKGGYDFWLVSDGGGVQWQRTFGTGAMETAASICRTLDGGYFVAGTSYPLIGVRDSNGLILKLDDTGDIDPACSLAGISRVGSRPWHPAGGLVNWPATIPGLITDSLPGLQVLDTDGMNAVTCSSGCPSLSLYPEALPGAIAHNLYAQAISAGGGTAPYTYAVSSGSLPPHFELAPDGVLSGTPDVSGASYTFTIRATDASGCSGSRDFALTVDAGNGPAITGISSKKSKPGTTAIATGAGFSTRKAENAVYFGEYKARVRRAKADKLTVTIPKKCRPGSVSVYVAVNGVSSNVVDFQVK